MTINHMIMIKTYTIPKENSPWGRSMQRECFQLVHLKESWWQTWSLHWEQFSSRTCFPVWGCAGQASRPTRWGDRRTRNCAVHDLSKLNLMFPNYGLRWKDWRLQLISKSKTKFSLSSWVYWCDESQSMF